MVTIVHKIRLKEGTSHEEFESWVTGSDYAACPQLSSLTAFGVQRVADPHEIGADYFEVIQITSLEAFEKDMQTPIFQSLVERFSKMADVVEEIKGELIQPGYRAS